MTQRRADQRRVACDAQLAQRDLLREQALQQRRLAFDLETAPAAQRHEAIEPPLHEQQVSVREDGAMRWQRFGVARPGQRDDDQPGHRAERGLGERAPGETRAGGDADREDPLLQAVLRPKILLAARAFSRTAVRQQMAPDQRDEGRCDQQDGDTERCEVEQTEGSDPGVEQRRAGQYVGRRRDHGREPAEQRSVGERHQQARGGDPGPLREPDRNRKQERHDPDVVHEPGEQAAGQHEHGDDASLAAASEPKQPASEHIGDAGAAQPLAEDEHRSHRHDGGVAESRDGVR